MVESEFFTLQQRFTKMDYEEEQKGELEVLESIYEGELNGEQNRTGAK